jgi:riboflavin kinase/FMN adenylyltransferase
LSKQANWLIDYIGYLIFTKVCKLQLISYSKLLNLEMKNILLQSFRPSVVLGLGFFDSVHIGHREIISAITQVAAKSKIESAIMTFADNPKVDSKLVYTSSERLDLLKECGIDYYLSLEFSQVQDMSPEQFLQWCLQLFDIKGIVCGGDYRFGKNAKGAVNFLQKFCIANNIEFKLVDTVQVEQEKVSTTLIKKYLTQGKLEIVNSLLGENYRIHGTVVRGRGMGRLIVPTINILPDINKHQIGDGVYGTHTLIDSKWLRSITNVGGQPTLNSLQTVIETHIIDYQADLYDRHVIVRFDKRLRDVIKFDDLQQLKAQILQDKKWT